MPPTRVALADTAASRRHCEVTFHANRFQLRDNHSTNGTLCNGERIDVQDLEFGDKIEVADTEMVRSGPRILDTPLSEILMHVQAAKTGAA